MAHENNKICRVFKALAEPKRYRIVTMLANGKMSASEILKHFTSRSRRCRMICAC